MRGSVADKSMKTDKNHVIMLSYPGLLRYFRSMWVAGAPADRFPKRSVDAVGIACIMRPFRCSGSTAVRLLGRSASSLKIGQPIGVGS